MMGNMWASSRKNLVCLTGKTLGETINETKKNRRPSRAAGVFSFLSHLSHETKPLQLFPLRQKNC